jgi:cytochrome P450
MALATLADYHLDESKIADVDLGSLELKQNYRTVLAEWAKNPPFYVIVDGAPQVIVASYQNARTVFLDKERYTNVVPREPGYEKFDKFMGVQTLAQMDGEQHNRIRRLMNPAFSQTAMDALHEGFVRAVDGLLDGIEAEGNEFDAMPKYASRLIVEVLLTVMVGLNEEQKAIFFELHRQIPKTTYTKPGDPFPPECIAAFDAARAMIEQLIAERTEQPGNDMISTLIQVRDEGDKLSDAELFDQIFTVCVAALSGTTVGAGAVLYGMYSHPEQLEEVRNDRSLMWPAIEECLRYSGTAGYVTFARFAIQDTVLDGTEIFAGMPVRISPQATSFDEARYPDPQRFDIHRNPQHIMAFGFGVHHCIGHRLARTSLRILFERLMDRFPQAGFVDPDFKPRYVGAVGELRIDTMPMRLR